MIFNGIYFVLRYFISVTSILPSEKPIGGISGPKYTNNMLSFNNFSTLYPNVSFDRTRQNLKFVSVFDKFEFFCHYRHKQTFISLSGKKIFLSIICLKSLTLTLAFKCVVIKNMFNMSVNLTKKFIPFE